MAKTNLLRVVRSDEQGFVLVNVEQTGPSRLDIQLIGTDGSDPFVARVKQKNIGKLRSASYKGGTDDWTRILESVLLDSKEHDVSANEVSDVELRASINGGTISVDIRKNIGGITQRLGNIDLTLDEEQEIALFDWAGAAASKSQSLVAQNDQLQASMLEQKLVIEKLNAQLDDLVKAKAEHEEILMKKFAELLNAKKAKIRDLLGEHPAPNGHKSSLPHRDKASRPSKRKIDEARESEDSDEVFETARVNGDQTGTRSDASDDAAEQTPDASDVETMQHDIAEAHKASVRKTKTDPTSAEPPPKRDLPFGKPDSRVNGSSAVSGGSRSPSRKHQMDEDETDDDDEL